MSQQEFTVIDEDKEYYFPIAPQSEGKGAYSKLFQLETKNWEPGDPSLPWRLALHPWISGLGPHRLNPSVTLAGDLKNRPSMVYAKGNLDASNEGFITFPPDYDTLESTTIVTSYYNTAEQLQYDYSAYGTTTYMGAGSNLVEIATATRNFNGKAYFGGGQFLFKVDTDLSVLTIVTDFGAGKTIYDIEPFNDELVIAMGETEKIWTMSTSETFTQATDATYAIALGRTGEMLWRAESKNLISNCITSPRTLTSWAPASPNQYSAGDTTYSITDLKEYGGAIAAIRPDGVFLPDVKTEFHNQTPQLSVYPDADNGVGAFQGWGYLWIPSVVGLIRMAVGEAPVVGPELSQRPDFRFRVKAGVEWNGSIYLLCVDQASAEQTFICKMTRSGASANPYVYHEWMRLGTTDSGRVLIVYTGPTNPTLIAGRGIGLALTTLGRGSGPDIDDPNYEHGTDLLLEPGLVIASTDLAIEIDLTGVKVVGTQVDGGTIIVQHDVDDTGTWTNLQSTVDGPGQAAITDEGWFAVTRYAQPNTTGHALYLRFIGTMPAGQYGGDRTEIYEAWAFGNAHPATTEYIILDVYSDIKARVRGLIQGRNLGGNLKLLSSYVQSGKIVEIKIPGYDPEARVRVKIAKVQERNSEMYQSGDGHLPSNITRITMQRVDFSGDLNGI